MLSADDSHRLDTILVKEEPSMKEEDKQGGRENTTLINSEEHLFVMIKAASACVLLSDISLAETTNRQRTALMKYGLNRKNGVLRQTRGVGLKVLG